MKILIFLIFVICISVINVNAEETREEMGNLVAEEILNVPYLPPVIAIEVAYQLVSNKTLVFGSLIIITIMIYASFLFLVGTRFAWIIAVIVFILLSPIFFILVSAVINDVDPMSLFFGCSQGGG